MANHNNRRPIAPADRQRLADLVEEKGERAATEEIGVSRQTLFRALSGRPLQPGTALLVEAKLKIGSGRSGAE